MGKLDSGNNTYTPLNMISSDMADQYWQAKIENLLKDKEVKKNAE